MSAAKQQLFRPESLEARQVAWVGRHTLALGAPVTVLSFASLLLTFATLALLVWGGYARRAELRGLVLPSTGLVQAMAPVAGRIGSVNVEDGQEVTKGTLLYVLDLETSTRSGETQQQILQALASQRAVVVDQISLKQKMRRELDAVLQKRIDNLRTQIQQTNAQLSQKEEFVAALTKNLNDYNRFLRSGIGNLNERNAQQMNWMRAKDELEELHSAVLKQQGALIEAEYQQSISNFQLDTEIGTMRSKIADLDQQVAAAESRQSIEVRAASVGTVTAVSVHAGQMVAAGGRVLTIVPAEQKMQAEFIAPSTSIGFIRPGQRVRLRYSAFPYQKFGQYWGTVTQVSKAALQADELKTFVPNMSAPEQSRTYFRVVVAPDRQDVSVYGHPESLRASMQVDARVMLERRPIYQWMLEPLYSLNGT